MNIKNLYKEKDNTIFEKNILKKNTGESSEISTEVLVEHKMKIFINDVEMATIVCTATNLLELSIGRVISEGIIRNINDIDNIYICEYGTRAKIYLKNGIKQETYLEENNEVESCCQDNISYFKSTYKPDKLNKSITIDKDEIFKLAKEFAQDSNIHKMTQGTHAAYLYHNGRIVVSFEDIGRHNALDKIIGYIYLNNFNPTECMIFTTGRVPVDMVRKAIYAKIGALVSKAVPTFDAVNLAREYNLNLICRTWQDSFQIFNQNY